METDGLSSATIGPGSRSRFLETALRLLAANVVEKIAIAFGQGLGQTAVTTGKIREGPVGN